ncbi:MAG: hypothetical protein CMJ64_13495 [Planctomycetaceae bacterium]|nr:hypothetical protein [Planctomycetaceae bacterium]
MMFARRSSLFIALAVCHGLVAANDSTSVSVKRVPWTTSRIIGVPDPPPPYKVEPAFPKLQFSKLVCITNAPGTQRLFVAEQGGKILSFVNDANCEQSDLFADVKAAQLKLGSIYGLAFHPKFEQNRFVFVCYTVSGDNPAGTRVVRFTMNAGEPPRIDPSSEQLVITWPGGGHNGGCLKFGHDGYLYVSTGDGAGPSPPDTKLSGQDVTNLLSTVFRIDVDHADGDKAYRVPADNPFVDLDGARPEIWAYGFRNPWKMSFDRQTGDLWLGDVGWELWEMIYRVERGGNYGWSIREGRQSVLPEQPPGPTPISPPTIDHPHSEAGSITGGFVYRGSRLDALDGVYVYGDYQSGIIWGARVDEDGVAETEELARTSLQLTGFGEDHAGELYLLDHRGQIYQLSENMTAAKSEDFPRKLSDTGLFVLVEQQTPAPGVLSYSINAEHWADFTTSKRWLAVPGDGQITINDKGTWQFPDGSVIAKTVSLDNVQVGQVSNLSSKPGRVENRSHEEVRLETQILHREDGSWRPYTYVWNDGQTDAELVDAQGFTRELKVRDEHAPGGVREQSYRFAARNECSLCHNPWVEARTTIFGLQSASLLGVHVNQLNRNHDFGNGSTDQIQHLLDWGLLDAKFAKPLAEAKRLADPYDTSADLNDRARSYLHVNCSQCHQFNAGGAATIALSHDVKLEDAQMLDVRPTQGTFRISNAKIIKPGDPYGSVLFYRISKLGGGRMPRLGSGEVDGRGTRLLHDWIARLPAGGQAAVAAEEVRAQIELRNNSPGKRAAIIERLTSSTRDALLLSHLTSRFDADDDIHKQVVGITKDHAAVEVRDLFEQFVPASQRTKRLGAVVNQAEILNLEANAARGKNVFFNSSTAACKNCHRIDRTGKELGPDLDAIGKKYRKGELLQQVLDPSKFMEPKYVPYVLETAFGRILTGLVLKKTDEEVVLQDAKNELHTIPANEVELLVRQQKSLMPELLLRDMTRQEVADLLAYLSSLK